VRHSANKHDNCCRSLKRYDAISAALEAGRSVAEVHPAGQPISHSVKYGFSRFVDGWGKPWPSGEDVGPGGVGWAWCEEWATKLLN
jgi:hypothetical protein